MFKKTGPFRVVAVQSHTVTIDEDGIHNTVSVDPISPTSAPHESQPKVPATTDNATEDHVGDDTPDNMENQQTSGEASADQDRPHSHEPHDFAVDRIIDHEGSGSNRLYRVC